MDDKVLRRYFWPRPEPQHLAAALVAAELVNQLHDHPYVPGRRLLVVWIAAGRVQLFQVNSRRLFQVGNHNP